MYVRKIAATIQRLASLYPVVSITGPRQSGKTTLARHLFPKLPYVSFENIDARQEVNLDPRAFLKKYAQGAIFDEVQHAPDLLSYMQQVVDEDQTPGRYIITGSQNFALSNTISQSLAGRIGLITLLPLSLAERGEYEEWVALAFLGGYPRLHSTDLQPYEFYPFYTQTYLERDVRQLQHVGDLGVFRNFIQVCAGHLGQTINYTSLAKDAGIGVSTARQWLSVLEASYIIFTLPTYYKNLNKRRVKMPKLYFYDTGLACSLLGFESKDQLERYYRKGALFENLVILELLKARYNSGLQAQLSFWRDYQGVEVDLIAEWGGSIQAIEIKAGTIVQPNMLGNLKRFCAMEHRATPYLVYSGEKGIYAGVNLMSYEDLESFATGDTRSSL